MAAKKTLGIFAGYSQCWSSSMRREFDEQIEKGMRHANMYYYEEFANLYIDHMGRIVRLCKHGCRTASQTFQIPKPHKFSRFIAHLQNAPTEALCPTRKRESYCHKGHVGEIFNC